MENKPFNENTHSLYLTICEKIKRRMVIKEYKIRMKQETDFTVT